MCAMDTGRITAMAIRPTTATPHRGRSPASTGGLITAITGATNLDGSSPFLEPQHARGFLYSASDFGPRFRGLRSPTKSPKSGTRLDPIILVILVSSFTRWSFDSGQLLRA